MKTTTLALALVAVFAFSATAIATPITTAPHWAVVQSDGARETTQYYYPDSSLQVTDLPKTTYSQTYVYNPGYSDDGCTAYKCGKYYYSDCNNYAQRTGCNGQAYYSYYEISPTLRYGQNIPGAYSYPYVTYSSYDYSQDGYYTTGTAAKPCTGKRWQYNTVSNYPRWTYTGLGYDGHYNPWYYN